MIDELDLRIARSMGVTELQVIREYWGLYTSYM